MNRFSLKYKLLVLTVVALGVFTLAADLPFNFKAGEVISADQVNQNFAALSTGKQERVSGECAEGSSIRTIGADGKVTCETDDVGANGSGYTAGNGLNLTGTEFSIDVAETQARVEGTCAAGSSVRTIGADGKVTCEVDDVGAGGGDAGVDSLNGETGSLVIQAGTGVKVDTSGDGKITVSATGSGGGGGSGLSLPYSGSANTSDAAFAVSNTTGIALQGSSQNGNAIYGISTQGYGLSAYSEQSYGVVGFSGSGIAGVYGESKISGAAGVQGVNSVGPGSSGVWGESAVGMGVRGSSASGTGVQGSSEKGYGVRGTVSQGGTGVYGENTSNSAGAGVQGTANYVNSVGVNGLSSDGIGVSGSSNTNKGVIGTILLNTAGPTSVAVEGVNNGQTGIGVRGEHKGNGYGVYGTAPQVGVGGESANVGVKGIAPIAMQAVGNAVQSQNSGGWAKAMVVLNGDGTIVRCYNGVTGSSSGGCGFSSSRASTGRYAINFGFDISSRFYSANGIPENAKVWDAFITGVSGTTLSIALQASDLSAQDGSVSIIVF